jgi:serine/threonine protein kinase
VIGAFYVLRSLSSGGQGSVFVVCRTEDRREQTAERFALKVPDFSANAARHLSETQFFQLFRAEASALMALPHHPNLARFVTFDLSARPRPILVMELVEGSSLDRLIENRVLDVARAFRALDQVLAGLEVMHAIGVGHLDLKPSNVVLRSKPPPSGKSLVGKELVLDDAHADETAVLVDFGLAGRNIRPGCASGPYGAPEVWGASPEGTKPTPMAADVYAFGCLAFEALTGDVLFDAESEVALIASHIAHDGLPQKLKPFTNHPQLQPLAELLFGALRRDPRARLGATELRAELKKVRNKLAQSPWPLRPT